MISNKTASLCQMVCATTMIAFVDHSLGDRELSSMLTKAMDNLIESSGGFSAFLTKMNDDRINMPARFYALPFLRASTPIRGWSNLTKVTLRFLDSLNRIPRWADVVGQAGQSSFDDTSTYCRRNLATGRFDLAEQIPARDCTTISANDSWSISGSTETYSLPALLQHLHDVGRLGDWHRSIPLITQNFDAVHHTVFSLRR